MSLIYLRNKFLIKFSLIVIILIIALFLISCTPSNTQQTTYNFKQGLTGVKMNFLDNTPPRQIYPQSEFKMILKMENLAAYDLKEGELNIVGLDEKYFQIQPLKQRIPLLVGKSLMNPSGGLIYLEMDGIAGDLFQNAEQYRGNYLLKLSYQSNFEFADTVCLNSQLYDTFDSGCKVNPLKSYSGQGAPVAVTNVEEIIYPQSGAGSVEFRIRIENRGEGKIKTLTLIEDKKKEAQLGGEKLDCLFRGATVFQNSVTFAADEQEAMLICKKTLSKMDSYQTSLALSFTYDYELEQEKELVLVK